MYMDKKINIFEVCYTYNLFTRGTEFVQKLKITKINIFWNQVLYSWTKMCNVTSPATFEDILSVNIWDNKDIKIATKPIFYKYR